jgi:CBS domain-containing protein
MQVSEVMTPGVECVRPEDSIAQAAERMRALNIGSLPVCGDNDRLLGMVTDRDITVRATAAGCDPGGTCVGGVMTAHVISCCEDQDVEEAARMMEQHQIRRLVVLDRGGRLVGIVSLGDLAVDSGDGHLAGLALEAISEPAAPRR